MVLGEAASITTRARFNPYRVTFLAATPLPTRASLQRALERELHLHTIQPTPKLKADVAEGCYVLEAQGLMQAN